MTKLTFRAASILIAALVVSVAAWGFDLAIFHHAADSDLEGDYYVAAFVGALSFVITGPLAFVALTRLSQEVRLRTWQFAVHYVAISLPTVSFQVLAYSASIIAAFIPGGPWTDSNIATEMTYAAITCCFLYAAYFFILYMVSKHEPRWMGATSVVLPICSLAVLVTRVLHS